MSETRWLSTKDAAERLGITSRTLYRLIDEG
ncbi:MAG: helix-turn-helix domain-containing protein, partial [Acidimicrobiia bacterium]